MIECRHIDFSYDSKTILQGIDLNIENGEFLCILGQSGCGKSTLLRLLAGLERPSAGEIRIDGEPVAGPDRHCSVVFQDYSLFPWMTTGANLTLALHAAQVGPEPVLFRAPGGNYAKYQKHGIGWPLIQWSSSAGDTGKNTERQLARHLTANAEDGSILLLHDIYMKTAVSAEEYLAEF